MFYSHEVLTSRKYGVATVWLVATLGSRSSLRKINRKAIQDVNVPKACQTITDPVAPMALRLQGNLLYGVSRVYMQQCGYVLSDAQNAHNAMHMMLRFVENAALDPEAGKAKPEQLVLADDPYFIPELVLPPPELLADLNLDFIHTTPRPGESQSLTPFGSQQAPATPDQGICALIIPSSSSHDMNGFNIAGGNEPSSVGGPGGMLGDKMPDQLEDPDFDFDADGNLVPRDVEPATPAPTGRATIRIDAGASARVRQEHEEAQLAGAELPDDPMDIDLPIISDGLPEGEAFQSSTHQEGDNQSQIIESEPTVAAPLIRKKRTARVLPLDNKNELRNRDLSDWNTNYLKYMDEASRVKSQKWIAAQARKNAEFYVWGAGIGGIGQLFGGSKGPTPFDNFYGDNLFKLFTGMSRRNNRGTKRDRDSGIDEATEEESRRVRHKSEEEQLQIGLEIEDEGMSMGRDEVELPREERSALDDQQMFSAMPWNMSASNRGSSAVPRTGQAGLMGSIGAQSSLASARGRAGRIVSASPLHGRGQPGGLDALKSLEGEDELGYLGPDDFDTSDPVELDAFQPSIRVCESLSAESENFLAFISNTIIEKRDRLQADLHPVEDILQADAAGDFDEVSFEELLPPADNSKMVACQGLMMVLSLSTKGLLNVRQEEAYGDIGLSLTEKAKELQEEEIIDQGQPEEAGENDEGQFSEQLQAGYGQENEEAGDDDDSLYAE
ncbi:hypothetical protein BS50DRAFT_647578 [Corynespora cassiicola Philippines]|uniref:Rad21/Rec8-like protein N-terminal domain-containing protein n=1 Tax=Corynespora cassiicola Philippines TaxID=1448308 RepID=A0A2T2NEJ5_CORCC|nr:hypothetical protein BS50DRAFT_647578 [Corynespora cassiicola Philippines]